MSGPAAGPALGPAGAAFALVLSAFLRVLAATLVLAFVALSFALAFLPWGKLIQLPAAFGVVAPFSAVMALHLLEVQRAKVHRHRGAGDCDLSSADVLQLLPERGPIGQALAVHDEVLFHGTVGQVLHDHADPDRIRDLVPASLVLDDLSLHDFQPVEKVARDIP